MAKYQKISVYNAMYIIDKLVYHHDNGNIRVCVEDYFCKKTSNHQPFRFGDTFTWAYKCYDILMHEPWRKVYYPREYERVHSTSHINTHRVTPKFKLWYAFREQWIYMMMCKHLNEKGGDPKLAAIRCCELREEVTKIMRITNPAEWLNAAYGRNNDKQYINYASYLDNSKYIKLSVEEQICDLQTWSKIFTIVFIVMSGSLHQVATTLKESYAEIVKITKPTNITNEDT
jgi:hypothetical protein